MLTGDLLAIDFKFYCVMIHQVISVFRNLLRCVLCPWMYSILEKLPYAAEYNVYSLVFGWDSP